MTQREALIAWYDSGAENRDAFIALIDAAQPQATPLAHMETMRLALEALQEWERVDVLGREPFVHRESWREAVQQRNQNHTAAIAALEKELT